MISVQIEEQLKSQAHQIRRVWLKYGEQALCKQGISLDDITNHVRYRIWMGLLTYDPTKNSKLHTYLTTIVKRGISDYLSPILRRKQKKHDVILWGIDTTLTKEEAEEDTPESLLSRREDSMSALGGLSDTETIVMEFLLRGFSIRDISKESTLPRHIVIKSILSISKKKQDE